MTRRTVFKTALGAAAALRAQEVRRLGLLLGFDAYTIRGLRWKAIELLDYAAAQNLDVVHLDLNDFESDDPVYIRRVKDHAARIGIVVDGSIGSVCPTSSAWRPANGDPLKYLLKGARAFGLLGATSMRVFLGGGAERQGPTPLEKHIESMAGVLREGRAQMMDAGLKVAVENHGDLQAWEMLQLIDAAGKDFVGVCLDSGNAVSVMEDPILTLETLAPHVLTTHIRDSAVFEHPDGIGMQWVALGEGVVDFPRFFSRFRELCPQVPVHLEILTGSPARVHAYLKPEFWQAYPKARAAEFARFVAMAKRGRPFMGSMLMAGRQERPPAYEAALVEQQRVDMERSLAYAKNSLGLGVRAGGKA
jgi:3-oxoisoapionate decarboxylase